MERQYLGNYRGKHILIQPHLDDLPFSISYFMTESVLDKTTCNAFTIFGKEYFNVRNLPKEESTVELLKEEEKAWFKRANIKHKRFELEEAGYRGVDSVRALFRPRIANNFTLTEDSINVQDWGIMISCMEQIMRVKPEYIWLPSGTGGHCDHLAVRQAALAVISKYDGVKGLIFYEELPYSMYSKHIDWEKVEIPGFSRIKEITITPKENESLQKEEELLIYYSQITEEQVKTMILKNETISIWEKNKLCI